MAENNHKRWCQVNQEEDAAHCSCGFDASERSEQLRDRIEQKDNAIIAQLERIEKLTADLDRLSAENAGLREALQDSLECNDNGRHCDVCHTNMRAALAARYPPDRNYRRNSERGG